MDPGDAAGDCRSLVDRAGGDGEVITGFVNGSNQQELSERLLAEFDEFGTIEDMFGGGEALRHGGSMHLHDGICSAIPQSTTHAYLSAQTAAALACRMSARQRRT